MSAAGGPLFRDVTEVFNSGAEELGLGELLMAEGFTLSEALSAIEIGDPRLDSGISLPEDKQKQPFDPLAPLLPEEVCWILDRIFACEMHWHAGKALAQTVYTCLYVHCVNTISPDYITQKQQNRFHEAALPIELVTLVVYANVMGLLKSCDLVHRELSKGNVHDCEDWQSDKADLSLFENVPTKLVLSYLDRAEAWLASAIDVDYREKLLYRLRLRKVLLRLLDLQMPQQAPCIQPLVIEARRLLSSIRSSTVPQLTDGSAAHSVFDPRVARQLNVMCPIRPIVLPTEDETWEIMQGFLDGWEQIFFLSGCESILAWNATGLLRASSPRWTSARLPFIRSLTQTVFSIGTGIFGRYSVLWLVERLYLETAHTVINQLIPYTELDFGRYADEDFFDSLSRLILQHMWASYHNRPRHRRHSMKVLPEWHKSYDAAKALAEKYPESTPESATAKNIPLVILFWRGSVVCDTILSGFELELYSLDECSFAYWFLGNVLAIQITTLNELLETVPQSTPAYHFLYAQLLYSSALKELSSASYEILCQKSNQKASRRWMNYVVRYKWALRREFMNIPTPDPFYPDFCAYLEQEKITYSSSPSGRLQRANAALLSAISSLLQLGTAAEVDFSLELCRAEFTQYHLAGLLSVCTNLREALTEQEQLIQRSLDEGSVDETSGKKEKYTRLLPERTLYWDQNECGWFPKVAARITTELVEAVAGVRL